MITKNEEKERKDVCGGFKEYAAARLKMGAQGLQKLELS